MRDATIADRIASRLSTRVAPHAGSRLQAWDVIDAHRRLLPAGSRRRLHAGLRAHRRDGDAAAGLRRAQHAGAGAADGRAGADRSCSCRCTATPITSTCTALGPVLVMLVQEILIGVVLGVTARLDDVGAAGRGRGGRPAARPRLRHRGRSDPGPAGRAGRQFPHRARHHADLRHRPASSGDRRAQRQLHALPAGRACRSPATSPSACTQVIAAAFRIGMQLAAPFLVFGLLFNLGLGVLARLMPQMQVFFVGVPLSILLGLADPAAGDRRDDGTFSTTSTACCTELTPQA